MSTFLWVGAGWLTIAVLAWSWLAAARRGDRSRRERAPIVDPRARPRH